MQIIGRQNSDLTLFIIYTTPDSERKKKVSISTEKKEMELSLCENDASNGISSAQFHSCMKIDTLTSAISYEMDKWANYDNQRAAKVSTIASPALIKQDTAPSK